MQFEPIENKQGVRLTWNVFPTTPVAEEKLAIPITTLYTPTKTLEDLGQVEYKPICCSDQSCGAILNPYCYVNYQSKTWTCAICGHRNNFPQHYHQITESHRPAELLPDYTTLEYAITTKPQNPVFLYLIDLAIIPQELQAVKNSVRQSLSMLPDNALVGLITYGANIHLYELNFDYCPKSFTFSGVAQTPVEQLTQRLGLSFGTHNAATTGKSLSQPLSTTTALPPSSNPNQSQQQQQQQQQPQQPPQPGYIPGKERFLTPIADCEAHFGVILDHLQADTWVYNHETRPSRCTGLAVALALNLLEFLHYNQNARILTLIGGAVVTAKPPVTSPPLSTKDQNNTNNKTNNPEQKGKTDTTKGAAANNTTTTTTPEDNTNQPNLGEIATNNFTDPLRSHHDMVKGEAPLFQPACDYYTKLSLQAVKNRHIVDIFACCLDQVGVSEMYPLVTQTGGELVLDDSFTRGVFQGSIKKILQRELIYDQTSGKNLPTGNLMMTFGSELKVLTSSHLLVNGGLGHCTNMNQPGQSTNHVNPLGAGKTQLWYLGGLMPDSTFSIYFSVNPNKPKKPQQQSQPQSPNGIITNQHQAYIQFITTYKTANGIIYTRVTTISRNISDDINTVRQSFDQEAAVVAMTRLALHKLVLDPHQDIRRWLDRQLIKLCIKFGSYTKDEPNSFKLSPDFALYPQQMYYLRRSPLIQIFNSSPDETVFTRTVTLKQDVGNTLTIIQPNLFAYDVATSTANSNGGPPQGEAVLLDSSQLSPQRILLLDTFFQVVIWYGQTMAQWKAKEIWNDPQFAYIGPLIRQPLIDAGRRISSRLPTPRFIECLEGGSQARFMLARLNPSTQATVGTDGEAIAFTEDITLNVFLQHLKRLVVQNAKE